MLLDNFSPMTGAVSPNRFGGLYGGKDQHGRAARGGVGGDGALPIGRTGAEGADPRALVGWSQSDVAIAAGLSVPTVKLAEPDEGIRVSKDAMLANSERSHKGRRRVHSGE